MAPKADLRVELVDIDELPDALVNPKGHDIAAIVASIRHYGVVEPSVLDERTGRLLAGHGRRDALRWMRENAEDPPRGVVVSTAGGGWLAPVVRGFSTSSDEEAQAYVVASNRLTERGGWINDLLAEVLRSTPEELLGVTGYSADQRDDLLALVGQPLPIDELSKRTGEPNERDMWPTLRLQVSPATLRLWNELVDPVNSTDDDVRLRYVLDHAALDLEMRAIPDVAEDGSNGT